MKRCPKCGKPLEDSTKICLYCGEVLYNPAEDKNKEYVIKKGYVARTFKRKLGSKINQSGRLILTNRRLIFLKDRLFKREQKLDLENLNPDLNVALEDIVKVQDGHLGRTKTIEIQTNDQDNYHFFTNEKFNWKLALEKAFRKLKRLDEIVELNEKERLQKDLIRFE